MTFLHGFCSFLTCLDIQGFRSHQVDSKGECRLLWRKLKDKKKIKNNLQLNINGINFDLLSQILTMDRPKCGCGNTQNPEGYCDGSHQNKLK